MVEETKTSRHKADTLRGEEFVNMMKESIKNAEWAPALSMALSDITRAELDGRSSIKDNLELYAFLADKANWIAVDEGNKIPLNDTNAVAKMDSCIRIATEASRRVHDYMAKLSTESQ